MVAAKVPREVRPHTLYLRPPRVASTAGRRFGLEVVQVVYDSPVAKAGLRPEDLILEVDDADG